MYTHTKIHAHTYQKKTKKVERVQKTGGGTRKQRWKNGAGGQGRKKDKEKEKDKKKTRKKRKKEEKERKLGGGAKEKRKRGGEEFRGEEERGY